jgi:hypothetical protein
LYITLETGWKQKTDPETRAENCTYSRISNYILGNDLPASSSSFPIETMAIFSKSSRVLIGVARFLTSAITKSLAFFSVRIPRTPLFILFPSSEANGVSSIERSLNILFSKSGYNCGRGRPVSNKFIYFS